MVITANASAAVETGIGDIDMTPTDVPWLALAGIFLLIARNGAVIHKSTVYEVILHWLFAYIALLAAIFIIGWRLP